MVLAIAVVIRHPRGQVTFELLGKRVVAHLRVFDDIGVGEVGLRVAEGLVLEVVVQRSYLLPLVVLNHRRDEWFDVIVTVQALLLRLVSPLVDLAHDLLHLLLLPIEPVLVLRELDVVDVRVVPLFLQPRRPEVICLLLSLFAAAFSLRLTHL